MTEDEEPKAYKNYYFYINEEYPDKTNIESSYKLLDSASEDYEQLFEYYRSPINWANWDLKNKYSYNLFERVYNPVITGLNEQYPVDEEGYVELLTNPYNKEETLKALSIRFDDMSSTDIIYVNGEKRMIGGTGVYNLDNGDEIYSVKVRTVAEFNSSDYQIAYEEYTTIINELKSKIEDLQNKINEDNAALEDNQMLINKILNADTSNISDDTVIDFNNKIKEASNTIIKNNETLKELRSKLDTAEEQLEKLRTSLNYLQPENLNDLNGRISELEWQIAKTEEDIQELAQEGYERKTLINNLQQIIDADKYEYYSNKDEIDIILNSLDDRKHFVEQLEEMEKEIK